MSFMYPRIISVYRAVYDDSPGAKGFINNLTSPVFTGIRANIQQKSQGRRAIADLPTDNISSALFRIFIKGLKLGDIVDKDIIQDDLGNQYQVISAYWNSLGFNLYCEQLNN